MRIDSNTSVVRGLAQDMASHSVMYGRSTIGMVEIDGAGLSSRHDNVALSLRMLLEEWACSLRDDAATLGQAAVVFERSDDELAWLIRR